MTMTAQSVTYGHDAAIARFSVTRYQRMIETGILTSEDKVELLENYVVLKMPKNPLHDGTIDLGMAALLPRIPAGWLLRVQQSLTLADSQPEPDFTIARGTPRAFVGRHPGPSDVGQLTEVADFSLLRDQRDKARIYARAGIAVYWIVNLVDRQVEVYSQPSGPTAMPAYGDTQIYRPGDAIPLVLDGSTVATIAVDELLP